MTGFSVDPRIFRELGALLVKRDSIALTELIKNAYDADAQTVKILGTDLGTPDGRIVVADDGVGMSAQQFTDGFLRIASRTKDTNTRRSEIYGRRFTGEKGVGRLSAHKLGAILEVSTVPLADGNSWTGDRQILARVDWDDIERQTSLEDLPESSLSVRRKSGTTRGAGTRLVISRLRGEWTEAELQRFIVEADLFEPPRALLASMLAVTAIEPLFDRLPIRDSDQEGDSFDVELQGDFRIGEKLWQRVPEAAWWMLEILSSPERVVFRIAPTKLAADERPNLVGDTVELERHSNDRPSFRARIFAREGARSARDRAFTTQVSGVRVYMEGFRISPYGDRGDDWLNLDQDYARRTDSLGLAIPDLGSSAGADREGLRTLPNRAYVGAVLLTHAGAPKLEAPIDREGFLDGPQFEALRETVRVGLDLLTRHRARLGVEEPVTSSGKVEIRAAVLADEVRVRDGLTDAVQKAKVVRQRLVAGQDAVEELDEVSDALLEISRVADRAVSDRAILRILAAAGTQMAVFVHEIENIVSALGSIRRQLSKLANDFPDSAPRLQPIRLNLARIEERVVSQAGYLSDVASVGVRMRRRRIELQAAVDRAWHLVEPVAERAGIELETEIRDGLRSPSIFPAELSAILSNLMTNALKAAGEGGTIRVVGTRDGRESVLRIENTGVRVDLDQAERWFRPFESTSIARMDPLLGQGMGLGLPIVRSILSDYSSSIDFVVPDDDMATCVEVRFR